MLVVSAGMQKSGSAYLYNVINDLLIAAGESDARKVKEKHNLESVMQWHNNNVGDLSNGLMFRLLRINFREKSFAVKTHSGPTTFLKWMLRFRQARVIYVYRDPRDVLLSVFDHGNKIIAEGKDHTFAKMVDFDVAMRNIQHWLDIWRKYSKMNNVLSIKYEELMGDQEKSAKRICDYLGISVPAETIKTILFKYDRNNKDAEMKGLHFNKAKVERFREDLSPEQLQKVHNSIGSTISEMGYSLS